MSELAIERRYRIEVGEPKRVVIWLVGCGGTGSFLALHLARMAWECGNAGAAWELVFVDPDQVERGNVGRQNFCPAEIGAFKAQALAERYSRAFGLRIAYVAQAFDGTLLLRDQTRRKTLTILAGCVDGPGGRQAMAQAVEEAEGHTWWVDGGNEAHSGQVLIGNRMDLAKPDVSMLGFCVNLPAPAVVSPELVRAVGAVQETGECGIEASCAELVAVGMQGLMINQVVAGWMAVYLHRLVVARDLDVWQTYIDLTGGRVQSVGIG